MSGARLVSAKRAYNVLKEEWDDIEGVHNVQKGTAVTKASDILSVEPGTKLSILFKDGSDREYEIKGDDPDKAASVVGSSERAEDRRSFAEMVNALERSRKEDKEGFEAQVKSMQFQIAVFNDIIARQQGVVTFALDSLTKVMGHNNALVAAGITPPVTDWTQKLESLMSSGAPLIGLGLAAAEHRGYLAPGAAARFMSGYAGEESESDTPKPEGVNGNPIQPM